MKPATVTMMTIFLVIALSCVIAQEFAIHLLYNRCESLNSAYNQLAISKTKILYMPYAPSEQIPAYSPADPNTETVTLTLKNKNPLNMQNPGNSGIWEKQTGIDKQWDSMDKLKSRFPETKGKLSGVHVIFFCGHLSNDSNGKIDLIHRMADVLRAMSRYERGIDLPNELFVSYEVLEKTE